jgi:hypothetical protein
VDLRLIKRLLRAGLHPLDFGAELIGDGAQRQAFLAGDYVIKRRVPAWQHDAEENDHACSCAPRYLYAVPVPALRRVGIKPPEQTVVGEWVIQVYYRPLTKTEMAQIDWLRESPPRWRNICLDIYGNVGVDLRTGRLHAFDW